MRTYTAAEYRYDRPNELDYIVTGPGGYMGKFINRELHCETGPAKIWDGGSEEWYFHGTLHRLDGPALIDIEFKHISWWIHGKKMRSYTEFQEFSKCSDEDIVFFLLKWGEIQ